MGKDQNYRGKVEDLFRSREGQGVSTRHMQRNIVTNPKGFFNLVESNLLAQLQQADLAEYYEVGQWICRSKRR